MRSIGAWSANFATNHAEAVSVGVWAKTKGIDGVVWTALRARFSDVQGKPACHQVMHYLADLVGDVRDRAEEYVRRAPAEIATPYRAEIERQLGWTPIA